MVCCCLHSHTAMLVRLVSVDLPSVLRHCWLGHLTGKTVPDMTYSVFGGTLNLAQLTYSSEIMYEEEG